MSDIRRVEVSNKVSKVDGIHTVDAIDLQEHLETVEAASGEWQFLSAPEDGRKKRPKHVEQYCSYK